jgi:hypothetical protein
MMFKHDCIGNGSWNRSVPNPTPVIPHFEWPGDEDALAKLTEQQSDERRNLKSSKATQENQK